MKNKYHFYSIVSLSLFLTTLFHAPVLYAHSVSARVTSTQSWSQLNWQNQDGTPFSGTPSSILEATLILEDGVAEVGLDVPLDLHKLTTRTGASGSLTLSTVSPQFSVASIDDSGSAGKTYLNIPPGNAPVVAGADTHLSETGNGTLTIGAQKRVTLVAAATWGGNIVMDETGLLLFSGTDPRNEIPFTVNPVIGTVILKAPFAVNEARFPASQDFVFDEGFDLKCSALVTGDAAFRVQHYEQRGGSITVSGNKPPLDNQSSCLMAHWRSTVYYTMRGGDFSVPNAAARLGLDGDVYFTLGGGESEARLSVLGLLSTSKGGTHELELVRNGLLSLGSYGLCFSGPRSLAKFHGGTVKTLDATCIKSEQPIHLQGVNTLICDHDLTLQGNIAGEGKIIKQGSGTLTFTVREISSPVNLEVEEGTLLCASDTFRMEGGTVGVKSGATFRQGGGRSSVVLGKLILENAGILDISSSSIAHINELSLGDGAVLKFELGPSGAPVLTAGTLITPASGRISIRLTGGRPRPAEDGLVLLSSASLREGMEQLFDLDLTGLPGYGGTLSVSNGNLLLKDITDSHDSVPPLTWFGESGNWNATEALWREPGGTLTTFVSNSPAVFNLPAGSKARVDVAADTFAGSVTDRSAGDLTLAGEKVRGTSLFLKEGSGRLTLEGQGIDGQEIRVTGGILKLGESLSPDALGPSDTLLRVEGEGQVDINYTDARDAYSGTRSPLTYGHEIRLKGKGYQNRGLLINTSKNKSFVAYSKIRLLDDATVNSMNRMDLRAYKLVGSEKLVEASLTGPADSILTLVNPEPFVPPVADDSPYFVIRDAQVSIGGIALRQGGGLGFEGGTILNLPLGISLGEGSTLRMWNYSMPASVPLTVEAGTTASIKGDNGAPTCWSPIRINEGAKLRFGGLSTHLFKGEISGKGEIEVVAGRQFFCSDVEQDRVTVLGGSLVYGDQSQESAGRNFPSEVLISGGNFGFSPYTNTVYRGMSIKGKGGLWGSRIGGGKTATAILEDSEVAVGGFSMGDSGNAGRFTFGRGTRAQINSIVMAQGASSRETLLSIEEGADVTVGTLLVGYYAYSGGANELRINGGRLAVTDKNSEIGMDAHHGMIRLNGGTYTTRGVTTRVRNLNGGDQISVSDEAFVMNGGTLNLGAGGFTTSRGFPRIPQVYLNGGTLVSTENWGVRKGQHLLIGNYPTDPEGLFTLDTADKTVTLDTALQGGADVLLKGNGNFNSWSRMSGGLTGNWRVENRGNNDLRGAASFAGGLSLGQDVRALIRIRDPERYVSLGFHASDGNGDRKQNFMERYVYGWFSGKMHDALAYNTGMNQSIFGFSGSFEVLNPGEYTFAMTYDDKISFWIDGKLAGTNPQHNEVGTFSVNLTRGWHTFRISAYNEGGVAGANIPDWTGAGLVIGYLPGSYRGTITVQNLTPFDTDSPDFRMCPATTLWHRRIANTGSSCPADWKTRRDFTSFNLVESIKMLHDPSWAEAKMSINEFEGWFRVSRERAGSWSFKGNYDDSIAFYVDGNLLIETDYWRTWKEAAVELKEGFHHFRIRTIDTGGDAANSVRATLKYRVNGGSEQLFDEDSLLISSFPYGVIGGEVVLEDGAVLENDADSPCEVVGDVSGTGTLKGPFRLKGGSWAVSISSREREARCLRFDQPAPDTLAQVGKISVTFDGKPVLSKYTVCSSLGLPENDPEKLAALFEFTVPGERVPYDGLEPVVENGMLILKNLRPGGMSLILK